MGKQDVMRDGVVLRGRSEPLQITISAYGGRVESSVLDEQDQPFSGARVVLVPDETQWKRQDLFKTTSSDQYGKFLLRGVPPGKYKVFAWEMLEEGAYNDPDFLRPRLDQGKLVELSPGSRVDAQLKLIRGDPINR